MPRTRVAVTRITYNKMIRECQESVCDPWKGPSGFITFLRDIGPRPSGKILIRKNPNLDFNPDNVCWAVKPNKPSTRTRRWVRINDELLTLEQASERLQINPKTVRSRLHRGRSVIDALTLPVRSDNPSERNRICRSVRITEYNPEDTDKNSCPETSD